MRDTTVWESARPYLYLRSTGDGRLRIGGEDDDHDVPRRRDANVERKSNVLRKQAEKLFPNVAFNPAFSWAGTFAETKDGLPFFGPNSKHGTRVQFVSAYGGNGMTFIAIGAGLISNLIRRQAHPLARLFSFDRLQR